MKDPGCDVALPSTTITIISPSQGASARSVFPHLKLKIKPQVNLPSSLAPPNARGKGLEENFKVVTPVGGKVLVAWHVDAKGLTVDEEDMARLRDKVQMAVGEWLVLKALGVETFDYPQDSLAPVHGGQLLFTPTTSLPAHSPLVTAVVPTGEPVAHLTRIDLSIAWTFPKPKGRKRAAKTMDTPAEADHLLEVPEAALSFEAIFAEPLESSQPSDSYQSSRDLSQHQQLSQRLSQPARESPQQLPLQSFQNDREATPEDINPETEVLAQVGLGMQQVIRLQMIRRFPFVFDGTFVQHQESLAMPSALPDAVNRFVTLSARFSRPLLAPCRDRLKNLEHSLEKTTAARVNSMARLMVYARPSKRLRQGFQNHSESSLAASQEQRDEDERVQKITSYLHQLKIEKEDKTVEDKLHDSLAEGLAAIGVSSWKETRLGWTKRGAGRTKLAEPEYFHEVRPLAQLPSDEDLLWDVQTPMPVGPHLYPQTPFSTTSALQESPEQFESLESYDDLNAEDCYEDDLEESLTPQASIVDLFPSTSFHQPYHAQFSNALQLQLGPARPSSMIVNGDEDRPFLYRNEEDSAVHGEYEHIEYHHSFHSSHSVSFVHPEQLEEAKTYWSSYEQYASYESLNAIENLEDDGLGEPSQGDVHRNESHFPHDHHDIDDRHSTHYLAAFEFTLNLSPSASLEEERLLFPRVHSQPQTLKTQVAFFDALEEEPGDHHDNGGIDTLEDDLNNDLELEHYDNDLEPEDQNAQLPHSAHHDYSVAGVDLHGSGLRSTQHQSQAIHSPAFHTHQSSEGVHAEHDHMYAENDLEDLDEYPLEHDEMVTYHPPDYPAENYALRSGKHLYNHLHEQDESHDCEGQSAYPPPLILHLEAAPEHVDYCVDTPLTDDLYDDLDE